VGSTPRLGFWLPSKDPEPRSTKLWRAGSRQGGLGSDPRTGRSSHLCPPPRMGVISIQPPNGPYRWLLTCRPTIPAPSWAKSLPGNRRPLRILFRQPGPPGLPRGSVQLEDPLPGPPSSPSRPGSICRPAPVPPGMLKRKGMVRGRRIQPSRALGPRCGVIQGTVDGGIGPHPPGSPASSGTDRAASSSSV
jgi:hypothetical protein